MRDEMNEEITLHINRAPHDKEHPYIEIPDSILDDDRLSITAKVMVCQILTKPDGWEFDKDELGENLRAGRMKTNTAVNNLIECGYLTITPVRNKGRFSHPDWVLNLVPDEV